MGKTADECNLDVDLAEQARALHRVVRAMHDGHCPNCGYLGPSTAFDDGHQHRCPSCYFTITRKEAEAALDEFRPYLARSVELFEKWRAGSLEDNAMPRNQKADVKQAYPAPITMFFTLPEPSSDDVKLISILEQIFVRFEHLPKARMQAVMAWFVEKLNLRNRR